MSTTQPVTLPRPLKVARPITTPTAIPTGVTCSPLTMDNPLLTTVQETPPAIIMVPDGPSPGVMVDA